MPSSPGRDHGRTRSTDSTELKRQDVGTANRPSGELTRITPTSTTDDGQKRLVFTDPVAFRYLEGEDCTTVVERRATLSGYELYVVEQWACSRKHLTFVIATFTGQEHHRVRVDVLGVPVDPAKWSPRLRAYQAGLAGLHAREKPTPLGALLVTNLSSFPSALTVIPVPGGDIRSLREAFILNEDLKRLGCSGRAGMDLSPPSAATRAKFSQTYRTSDRVPIAEAVIELVKMCQVALVLFTVLAPEYADGLLCDLTEQAIRDWWAKFGTEFYNVEPSDGILGPTTVAALLGMLLGARNRLKEYGSPVAKDVFDLKATRRGISNFQRWQKMTKTRQLDPETFDRLQRVTSKAANNAGRAVSKAVKSTVADLSGKGGEMVRDMVRGDKAGMAEVETVDINKFIATVSGERCKWLWHGKQRKNPSIGVLTNIALEDGDVFSGDEHGSASWGSKGKEAPADPGQAYLERVYSNPSASQTSLEPSSDKEPALRKQVLKSMTGKMSDARSGLGRFRDVVGRTGLHRHGRLSRDDSAVVDGDHGRDGKNEPNEEGVMKNADENVSMVDHQAKAANKAARSESMPLGVLKPAPAEPSPPRLAGIGTLTASEVVTSPTGLESAFDFPDSAKFGPDVVVSNVGNASSANASSTDLLQARPETVTEPPAQPTTRSTLSLPEDGYDDSSGGAGTRLPRSLSFGAVDAVFDGRDDDLERESSMVSESSVDFQWALENYMSARIRQKLHQLQALDRDALPFVKAGSKEMQDCEARAEQNYSSLNESFYKRSEEYEALRQATTDLVGEEKASLNEALRDIEVLGARLEYELNALLSKVEDVEDGVGEFERQVQYLEERVVALEEEEARDQSWYRRLSRLFVGGR